jgi:hypothetical protein
MQRSVSSALLIVFAFALVGVYPLQWQFRMAARTHMRAMVRTQGRRLPGALELSFPLSHGTVSDERFAWEEKDEFSLDGRMYDVISLHVSADKVTFLCVADAEEGELIAQAESTAPSGHTSGVPASLLRCITCVYLLRTEEGWQPAFIGRC